MANEYDYEEWIAYCEWLEIRFGAPETEETKNAAAVLEDLPF